MYYSCILSSLCFGSIFIIKKIKDYIDKQNDSIDWYNYEHDYDDDRRQHLLS
jgi:hypothetical protein